MRDERFRCTRRTMLKVTGGAAAALCLPAGWASSRAVDIDVLTFPGTYNLLIWAAQEQGFFAAEGLNIAREPTTTSMYLINNVNSATFPIGSSSIDNVVAYNEGQGQIELDRPADLFAFMNIKKNMTFPLVVQADIESVADLEGRTLAVDAVSTGFSFVLREILREHGLGMQDYKLASVGNAQDRLNALKEGSYAGAILTPPFDRMAEQAGLKTLTTSRDVFQQYQGTTFITSRYWAQRNGDTLTAYCRAMLDSLDWVRDPQNRSAAARILAGNISGMPQERAEQAVAALGEELSPDFNMAGIKTVLDIRSRYGRPQKSLTDPEAYIDRKYLSGARESRPV